MRDLMARELNTSVRLYGDIHHTLSRPAVRYRHQAVRLLTPNDLTLVESAPVEVRGGGYGSTGAMLSEAVVAGAIVGGELVAIACTYARTEHHADLGVATLEQWRGHSFATAAASLVAAQLQQEGVTPVWSAGEDNAASLRVARKLGFDEVSRRTYVIPDQTRPWRTA
jgi:hypothetical protein